MKTLLPAVVVTCVLLCVRSPVRAQGAKPEVPVATQDGEAMNAAFQLLIDRYRELLLRGELPQVDVVKNLSATLGADGRWPDVDYADKQPAVWKTAEHLARVRTLSRAQVDPQSPLRGDAKIEETTMRALDYWTQTRPKNPNWWHNEIGVPQTMRDIMVLLGDRLQGERRDGALAVYRQFRNAKAGDGANTMWMANLGLIYGAMTRDAAMVERNSQVIAGEMRVTAGEGVQSDGSYHQHGARLQQFHYGGAFLNDSAQLGWQLRGTPWAIPKQNLQVIGDCILKGSQWMSRGTATVPGTLDRSVSRPGALGGTDLRQAARFLREALPGQAGEFDALIARQSGTGAPLNGFRTYPRSDFGAYQRPTFSFFVKTVSSRTLKTESINGENRKGHLLNGGDHYLLRDGQEYAGMPPVWNWDLLPGLTYAKAAGEVQPQAFVGGVSDGQSGASAMDYRVGSKEAVTLSAHKLWACHGDTVVCLIGDLNAPGVNEPIRTALEQCLLRGPVTMFDAQGSVKTLPEGEYAAQSVKWVHHAGLVYAPLGDTPVALKLGPVTGSWSDINKSGSTAPVTSPVFLPTLEHGTAPQGVGSGFVIAAAATPADAAKRLAKPTWQVLRNDANCQAVRFANGTLMASFTAPGTLESNGQPLLAVEGACLVMQNQNGLWVSDPAQKGGILAITVRGKRIEVNVPADGQTVNAKI